MLISVGISDHSLAYLTGVTGSWGSRSMCMWSINRQKAALRSQDRSLSAMHLKTSHTQKNIIVSFLNTQLCKYWCPNRRWDRLTKYMVPQGGEAVSTPPSFAVVGVKLLFYRTKIFVFFLKLRVYFGGANDKSNNPSKAPLQKIKKTTKSNWKWKLYDTNLSMRSTSNCLLMLLIARYCLSRHIRENRFNWYLDKKGR